MKFHFIAIFTKITFPVWLNEEDMKGIVDRKESFIVLS